MIFGQLLRDKRHQAGLTGAQVAQMFGRPRQRIVEWENNKKDPRYSTGVALLKMLDDYIESM